MIPINILEDFRPKLEHFNKLTEPQLNAIVAGTKFQTAKQEATEINDLKNHLNKLIEYIAKTGDMSQYDWKTLKNIVILKIKDNLINMQSSFPDCKPIPGESFDEQMEVILQFMCGFDEKYEKNCDL